MANNTIDVKIRFDFSGAIEQLQSTLEALKNLIEDLEEIEDSKYIDDDRDFIPPSQPVSGHRVVVGTAKGYDLSRPTGESRECSHDHDQ